MAPPRLRIGLVGAGRRGRAHAATIAELPDLYELTAICDPNEASARSLAAGLAASAYAHVGEMLRRATLDAVLIATPPETHHLVAKAAADARVHMLLETPLALTRAMMDFIAEAAEKAGVWVEVGENYGRRPAERLNAQALRSGLVGQLLHLSCFNAPANHGTCYHTMSLFRLYADLDVEEVEAWECAYDLDPAITGAPASETRTEARLKFANGVTGWCSFVSSWASPLRSGRPRVVTAEGTGGHIATQDGLSALHRLADGAGRDYPVEVQRGQDASGTFPVRFAYQTMPPVEVAVPFEGRVRTDVDGVGDGLARAAQLASLHRAVTTGLAPECGLADARRSQELGIAIAESARLGRPLPSRLADETTWERDQHEALRRRWGADPIEDADAILTRGR